MELEREKVASISLILEDRSVNHNQTLLFPTLIDAFRSMANISSNVSWINCAWTWLSTCSMWSSRHIWTTCTFVRGGDSIYTRTRNYNPRTQGYHSFEPSLYCYCQILCYVTKMYSMGRIFLIDASDPISLREIYYIKRRDKTALFLLLRNLGRNKKSSNI